MANPELLNVVYSPSEDIIRPLREDEKTPWLCCRPEEFRARAHPAHLKLSDLAKYLSSRFDKLANCCIEDICFPEECDPKFKQQIKFGDELVERFRADFWQADGPSTMSFAIAGEQPDEFEFVWEARLEGDLAAIEYVTFDEYTHPALRYAEVKDFSNSTLSFSISLMGDSPDISDAVDGLVMTVERSDGPPAYIRLANYADPITLSPSYADITLPWNSVQGGFYSDQPFGKTQIERIFISVIPSGYAAGSPNPFSVTKSGVVTVSNIKVIGDNSFIRKGTVQVPAHQFSMCTGYDDSYNINPKRIIDSLVALGYGDTINHYCGMSHFPSFDWDSNENDFRAGTASHHTINKAAKHWHEAYADAAKAANFKLIFAISFEFYSLFAHPLFLQRDFVGNIGATGYTPPSHLISPASVAGIAYLRTVFSDFASILQGANLPVLMQVGEPWWWVNPNDGAPCIFDMDIRTAWLNAKGYVAPQILNIDSPLDADQTEYVEFARDILGAAVLDIANDVRANYPGAQVSLLLFIPAVHEGNRRLLNFPVAHYSYPNLDFFQTEAYDWIIVDELDKPMEAFSEPIEVLNYPENKIHYLAGFVPDQYYGQMLDPNYDIATDGPRIWNNIMKVSYRGKKKYPQIKQYIWAYNQVVRSAFVPDSQMCLFSLDVGS